MKAEKGAKYSFTICSSSALDGGYMVNAMPQPLNLH